MSSFSPVIPHDAVLSSAKQSVGRHIRREADANKVRVERYIGKIAGCKYSMYFPMEPQTRRPEPQFLLMNAICNALTTRMQCQAAGKLQGHKHHGPPGIGSGIVRPKELSE